MAKKRNASQVIRVDILETIEVVKGWLFYKGVHIYEEVINADTRVLDILTTGSNIVVCNGEELHPHNPHINYQHSWGDTLHYKPETNVQKCKDWCEKRRDRNYSVINLTIQVTLENMPWRAWVEEVIFTKNGLQSHAHFSNLFLEKWLDNE